MSVGIPVHDNTYKTIAERANFYEQLRDTIGALPDVDLDRDLDQRYPSQQRLGPNI